jgi:DNA polymerase
MPWRRALDELMRRYLRQQIELGGREVILGMASRQVGGGGGASPIGAGSPRPTEPPADPGRTEPVRAAAVPPRGPPDGGSPARDWRAGAPAIPGPGIVIEAPPVDLLSPKGPDWPSLDVIAAEIGRCEKCFLCEGRTKTVPGEGHPRARLVLVGEGPGQREDETGRPFVGRAGELLTDILRAIGFAREEVFICNVVKCRPPQNRKPLPDEMAACLPYLEAQIGLIRPSAIVALGATAAEALLNTRRSLSDLRGKVHSYRGIPLVVTYHPAALLRNPNWKKPTWDDVRIARQLVDR